MNSLTHTDLIEIRSMITQMLGNAGDSVRMAGRLAQRVRELPPPDSDLFSRLKFARAGLQSYVANFFQLPEDDPQTEIVRIAHDAWIRGVSICVLPALDFEAPPQDPDEWYIATSLRALLNRYGTNWRGLVDLTWRIEDSQGFIQDGNAAVRGPAASVSGDGEFSADLDWKLKRDQNIAVTCVNRIERAVDQECDTHIARDLPWVAVCFWAERDRK